MTPETKETLAAMSQDFVCSNSPLWRKALDIQSQIAKAIEVGDVERAIVRWKEYVAVLHDLASQAAQALATIPHTMKVIDPDYLNELALNETVRLELLEPIKSVHEFTLRGELRSMGDDEFQKAYTTHDKCVPMCLIRRLLEEEYDRRRVRFSA